MILWFSGTGNSRYVAEQLAARLGQQLRRLTPDLREGRISLSSGDTDLIWICPVYSWGIPPYVRSILQTVTIDSPEADSLHHHLVLTCGDDCGLAVEMWRRDIRQRHWLDRLAFSVTMPNNYVCMKGFDVDPKDVEQKKLSESAERIAEIAGRLETDGNSEITDVIRGSFAWVKTKIIYPWFVRHAMSPKPFRHTSDCISCGKCAAACPTRNITMTPDIRTESTDTMPRQRKYPHWSSDCAGCLACYHICPRHAVMYGKSTINKGQYRNPFVFGHVQPN